MKTLKGFTLMEMVITITLTAFIGAGLSLLLRSGVNNYFIGKQLSELSSQTSLALARINQELRSAYSISVFTAQQVTFTTVDGNSIDYQLSGSNLLRTENGGTAYTLTNKVKTLNFSYYTAQLESTSLASDIAMINISLELENTEHSYSLIASVYPRNLS